MSKRVTAFREGIFLEGTIEKGKPILVGSRCRRCGKVFFPKRDVCGECYGKDLEEIPLSTKGKLFTYSVAYVGPRSEVPYAFGYIELPEGVKIFALLTEADPNELRVDMDVELTTKVIRSSIDDREVLVYAFKPLQGVGGK
jgi:uncharacterized OB-fold protein